MFLAAKDKALIQVTSFCNPGTNDLISRDSVQFERGDCQLLDIRHPNAKNSMRVDAKSSSSIIGASVRNKRKLYEDNQKIVDRVK